MDVTAVTSTALGWFAALLPIAVAALLIGAALWGRRNRHPISGGAVTGFDEVWAPGAAEARAVWDAEQSLPIEIPSPDGDNPLDRDLSSGRITITPR